MDLIFFYRKRSQTADHSINEKFRREQTGLARKVFLNRLIKSIDTSDQQVAHYSETNIPVSAPKIKSSSRSNGKRRRGKGRKNRKGRKRIGKKGRKNGRRRSRAVANRIATFFESYEAEEILHVIAEAIGDDYEHSDNLKEVRKFFKTSARKCKWKTERKTKRRKHAYTY